MHRLLPCSSQTTVTRQTREHNAACATPSVRLRYKPLEHQEHLCYLRRAYMVLPHRRPSSAAHVIDTQSRHFMLEITPIARAPDFFSMHHRRKRAPGSTWTCASSLLQTDLARSTYATRSKCSRGSKIIIDKLSSERDDNPFHQNLGR